VICSPSAAISMALVSCSIGFGEARDAVPEFELGGMPPGQIFMAIDNIPIPINTGSQ